MAKPKSPTLESEVGRFICPNTHQPVPLLAAQSLAFIHWPMVVRNCPACGRKHTVELRDVEHLPVYGYE